MNRKIAITMSSIVLFAGAVGSFYYLKHQQKPYRYALEKKQTTEQASSSFPIGSGNIQDPTTWSHYTFAHDFSIVYPPEWDVLVDKDGNGVSFQTVGFHQDDDFTMPYGNSTNVSYAIFGQTDGSDMSLQNGDQFSDDQTQETNSVSNLTHIQIDGLPAVEFNYYPTDNTNFVKTRIAIQKEQKFYHFDAIYAEKSGKTLFEQMVKSIHFF